MDIMGRRYPQEFRDGVVRIARKGDGSHAQLATDFGISEASIYNWMKLVNIDGGVRPGLAEAEAKKRT